MNISKQPMITRLAFVFVAGGLIFWLPDFLSSMARFGNHSSALSAQVLPTTSVAHNSTSVSSADSNVKVVTTLVNKEIQPQVKPVIKTTNISPEVKLAQCLTARGVKFYGAFWCPHCQKQKALFGKASKELPYVECSTPNGKAQTSVCTDAGITSYPTWKFPDETTHSGEMTLSELSVKTNCPLE